MSTLVLSLVMLGSTGLGMGVKALLDRVWPKVSSLPDAECSTVHSLPVERPDVAHEIIDEALTVANQFRADELSLSPKRGKRVHKKSLTRSASVKKAFAERRERGIPFQRLGIRLGRKEGWTVEQAVFAVLDLHKAGKTPQEIFDATGVSKPSQGRFVERVDCLPGYLMIIERWHKEQRKLSRELKKAGITTDPQAPWGNAKKTGRGARGGVGSKAGRAVEMIDAATGAVLATYKSQKIAAQENPTQGNQARISAICIGTAPEHLRVRDGITWRFKASQ